MTLPYELARELKEAGFSQKNVYPCEICGGKTDCAITQYEDAKPPYIPTLEELIEACGDRFNLLVLGEHGFVASFYDSEIQKNNVHGGGKTPSEAVANLWLALNPRQNN